jgi:hypothetical protein
MNLKQCECGENNPDNFYKSRKTLCKKCCTERQLKRYYNMSPDQKMAFKSKRDGWIQKNYLHYRLTNSKARAKVNGIPFEIDIEHLKNLWEKQNGICYYTGKQMILGPSKKKWSCVSIDRVNSDLGYTKENTVLCRGIVNLMKNELSISEFLEIIDEIRLMHPLSSGISENNLVK